LLFYNGSAANSCDRASRAQCAPLHLGAARRHAGPGGTAEHPDRSPRQRRLDPGVHTLGGEPCTLCVYAVAPSRVCCKLWCTVTHCYDCSAHSVRCIITMHDCACPGPGEVPAPPLRVCGGKDGPERSRHGRPGRPSRRRGRRALGAIDRSKSNHLCITRKMIQFTAVSF
jgi:hypothetical protein